MIFPRQEFRKVSFTKTQWYCGYWPDFNWCCCFMTLIETNRSWPHMWSRAADARHRHLSSEAGELPLGAVGTAQLTCVLVWVETGMVMMIDLRNIQKTYITDDIGNRMAYVMINLLWHLKTCKYTTAQIAPLSFQAAIPHKPRQVRWGELHTSVVTAWSPACLHK